MLQMKFNVLLIMFFLFSGCAMFAKENVPYAIKGEFTVEDSVSEYELGGVDIYFYNKSDKNVRNFTVVFFLFDEDGEPFNTTKSNLVFNIEKNVETKDSIEFCLSIDDYVNSIPDESCFIDYLYVSKIVYEDGSVWTDPFGLNVF